MTVPGRGSASEKWPESSVRGCAGTPTTEMTALASGAFAVASAMLPRMSCALADWAAYESAHVSAPANAARRPTVVNIERPSLPRVRDDNSKQDGAAELCRTVSGFSHCCRLTLGVAARSLDRQHVDRDRRLFAAVHRAHRCADAQLVATERQSGAAGHAPTVRDVRGTAAKAEHWQAAELDAATHLGLRSECDAVAHLLARIGRQNERAAHRVRQTRTDDRLELVVRDLVAERGR